MEFSKLKLEIYDLLGTLVPGLLAMAFTSITISGWHETMSAAAKLTGAAFTVLLFLAFAAGQIVQEASDRLVKIFRGGRFFKQARDRYWKTPMAVEVRKKINVESGIDIVTADDAFDYCLTRVGERFAKRDTFLAISDLARSLWMLSILSLLPLLRDAIGLSDVRTRVITICVRLGSILVVSYLAWGRMLRFRELSELPVFRSFLALNGSSDDKPQSKLASDAD